MGQVLTWFMLHVDGIALTALAVIGLIVCVAAFFLWPHG